MEVIGNPQVFAVQLGWHPDPETYKPWMFGVFSVSVCGERLGSPTEEAVLNDILVDLHGWKKGIGKRCEPALMAADPVTAFLSIENAYYGLEHLEDKIPRWFMPLPVLDHTSFEILGIDTLGDYRIYCIEDDATSRLLYARIGDLPRECRVPRAVLADVLNRTIGRLDGWFKQLPETPGETPDGPA